VVPAHPARHDQFALSTRAVADDRRKLIWENPGERREVAGAERSRGWRRDGGLRRRGPRLLGRCGVQLRDRFDEALAVPEGNAKLLEIGFGHLRQDFRVDLVLAEGRFVLAEANPLEPLADVHGRPHMA
jgi:hypothetical protein